MEKRIYVMKAGNFKQQAGERLDKWADGRWAKLVGSTGIEKTFDINKGEMAVTLSNGESITYVKGWDNIIDKKQTFTANFGSDLGRFVQFD